MTLLLMMTIIQDSFPRREEDWYSNDVNMYSLSINGPAWPRSPSRQASRRRVEGEGVGQRGYGGWR